MSDQSVSDGGEVGEGGDLVQEAYSYLTEHRYAPGCADSRKRSIRKKAGKFVVRDGELFSRREKARYETDLVGQYRSKIMLQGFLNRACLR